MGFGGSTSAENTSGGINREVRYSFGGGGVTLEYTLPFIKGFAVSLGTIIGAASQNIEIYRNNGSFSWEEIWSGLEGNAQTGNFSRILENSYWILSPTLNIDIPFYRFSVLRVGAGYNFSLGNSWSVENDKDLRNAPSGLNGDGFFIQSGIL
jgi:hypothetical protein